MCLQCSAASWDMADSVIKLNQSLNQGVHTDKELWLVLLRSGSRGW